MKGHALAQQAQVELVPDVPLHPLRHQFRAVVAGELEQAPYELGAHDQEADGHECGDFFGSQQNGVEGPAEEDGHGGG